MCGVNGTKFPGILLNILLNILLTSLLIFSGIRTHLHKVIGQVYEGTAAHIDALQTFPADDQVSIFCVQLISTIFFSKIRWTRKLSTLLLMHSNQAMLLLSSRQMIPILVRSLQFFYFVRFCDVRFLSHLNFENQILQILLWPVWKKAFIASSLSLVWCCFNLFYYIYKKAFIASSLSLVWCRSTCSHLIVFKYIENFSWAPCAIWSCQSSWCGLLYWVP